MKNTFYILLFMLAACSKPEIANISKSINIKILSPNIKFSGSGFLNFYKNKLNLQIYKLGAGITQINIGKFICFNNNCISKEEFNNKFLNKKYPKDFISEILNSKPILNNLNLEKTKCGFIQNIKSLNIEYEICNDYTKFTDKKNNVKIQIKSNL